MGRVTALSRIYGGYYSMQVSTMGEALPYVRKTKRRPSVTKRARIIGIGSGVVATALLFGGLYMQQQEVIRENASQAEAYTPAPVIPTTAPATTEATAQGSLTDASTPWTVAIVGDSTGNDVGEFVYGAFTALGEETGRPVIIHNWSVDTNTYISETRVAEGEGQPIIVWNGSAPGKSPAYSLERMSTIVPERPDLFVVNHGHNASDVAQAVNGVRGLTAYAGRAWETEPKVIVTLQNPRTDDRAALHDQVVEGVKAAYVGTDVTLVDADAAFRAGDLAAYLNDDGLHPSQEGSRVWAETFLQALPR